MNKEKLEMFLKREKGGATDYWLTNNTFNALFADDVKKLEMLTNGVLEVHLESGDVIGIQIGEKVLSQEGMAQIKLEYFNDIYRIEDKQDKAKTCKIL